MYQIKEIRSINLKEDSPISTLFGTFGAWFKVFFWLFYLPFSLFMWALIYTPRVNAFIGRLQMLTMNFVLTHKHPTQNEITSLFIEQIKLLLRDHYVLAIVMIMIILGLFMYAVCFIGLKHSFYGKISLGDTIKEGVDRIGKTTLFFVLTTICGIFLRKYLTTLHWDQTVLAMSLTNKLCLSFFVIILFSMPMMLFSAVYVFSDEGPWWAFPVSLAKSFIKSFAIYYKNILKYIYLFLITIVFWIVMYLLLRLGIYLFGLWVKHNQEVIVRYALSSPDSLKNLLRMFVFVCWFILGIYTYVSFFLTAAVKMTLFIMYPELLENEEEKEKTNTNYSELSDTFYKQLPTTMASQAGNQDTQNASSTQGSLTPNNGGEGLSVPIAHKSDKPFLNQKIDKEEFDRLTSKE